MQQIVRPPERKRIPVVLTVQEVQAVLGLMAGTEALLAALLYGRGLRLREALGSRVKDVDFDRHAIVVRSGKGELGSGCFRHPGCRSIRRPVSNAALMYLRSG